MTKNKVNEWQELSLKKDVEKIHKATNNYKITESTITVEVGLVALATIFDNKSIKCPVIDGVIVIVAILTMGYAIFTIYKYFKNKIMNHNKTANYLTPRELVDLFDNEICYSLMTSNSYNELLSESIENKESQELYKFYYIESWYYINKAKSQLSQMRYKTNLVFSDNVNNIVYDNKIAIERIENVTNLICELSESVNILADSVGIKITSDNNIYKVYEEYDKSYKFLIQDMNATFDIQLKYKKLSEL